MNTAVLPASAEAAARPARRSIRRPFYVSLALLMTAMVIVGFWPTYFGPLLRGEYDGAWIFHLHGAVFLGWMGLLVTQVALVSFGRTRVHRRLGTVGVAYGSLALAVGVAVSFVAPVMHIGSGAWDIDAAAAFLALPLTDMVLFAGFFSGAILYRHKPEIHKRLMLLATIALLFAAVARRVPFDAPLTFLILWLTPLFAAMAYDWRSRRRVHATYVIGLAILVVAFARVFFMNDEPWLSIGRALLAPLV